jgi:hypothetical protein
VGLIIGKGGETIKSLQTRTGARIQVVVIVYLGLIVLREVIAPNPIHFIPTVLSFS